MRLTKYSYECIKYYFTVWLQIFLDKQKSHHRKTNFYYKILLQSKTNFATYSYFQYALQYNIQFTVNYFRLKGKNSFM